MFSLSSTLKYILLLIIDFQINNNSLSDKLLKAFRNN